MKLHKSLITDYPNKGEGNESEDLLKRLNGELGKQIRTSGSGNKQSRCAAAELQMIPQEICQINPLDTLCKAKETLLGFCQRSIITTVTMTMMVVVMMVVLIMVSVVVGTMFVVMVMVVIVLVLVLGVVVVVAVVVRMGRALNSW